jgi:GNAT superfamily N-acetyltransferase
MAVEVRPAQTAGDFDQLYELLTAYEADLPPDLRHGCVPDASRLRLAAGDGEAAFLATVEERAVGCVAVRRLDRTNALIMRLFVEPGGRRAGAARALVAAALAFLREQHYARVVLDTDKAQLEPAYRLYRSFGFEECAAYGPVDYASPTFMELHL